MPRCHTCKKESEKLQKCSKCKTTYYCSRECQASDWNQHKRSVCLQSPVHHKIEKLLKQYSQPNYPMGALAQMEDAAWAERVRNPQPTSVCDGCFRPWDETFDPKNPEHQGYEPCGPRRNSQRCGDCDWTVCRDCLRPEAQERNAVDRPTGHCRCLTSNFGIPYCTMTTSYLHGDQRKQYKGDRHPEISSSGYRESAFEDKPRKCRNCGQIKRCLKKEHLTDYAPEVLLKLK